MFDQNLIEIELSKSSDQYSKIIKILSILFDKNNFFPLNPKKVTTNHAPFINKELSKTTTKKFKALNKYVKIALQGKLCKL